MWKILLREIINLSTQCVGNIVGVILKAIALVIFGMITLGLLCAFLIVLISQWLDLLWACLIVFGFAILIMIILCCCRSLFAKPVANNLRRLIKKACD